MPSTAAAVLQVVVTTTCQRLAVPTLCTVQVATNSLEDCCGPQVEPGTLCQAVAQPERGNNSSLPHWNRDKKFGRTAAWWWVL